MRKLQKVMKVINASLSNTVKFSRKMKKIKRHKRTLLNKENTAKMWF